MTSKTTIALLVVAALAAPAASAQFKDRKTGESRPAARTSPAVPDAPAVEPPPPQATSGPADEAEPDALATSTDEGTFDEQAADTEGAAPPARDDSRFLTTLAVAALIFLLTVAGFLLQMRRMTRTILAALPRGDDGRHDRDRVMKELAIMKNDTRDQIASLRATVQELPGKIQQRVQQAMQQPKPASSVPPPAPRAYEAYEERRPVEDARAQLLTLANQIVQQMPTTLDAVRARTGQLQVRVSAWPAGGDGSPVAFIVEHGNSYYAIPNVIKPARLPQDWFNRADFGVNDEIQRVVSLPILQRRGDEYAISVPGVFER